MWHPDGLPGEVPFPCLDRGSHLGCVCHDPRVSGHVRHDPQTAAAGPRGMGATTPVLRGMCATTPTRGHASRRVLPATCHTVNVASIIMVRSCTRARTRIGPYAARPLTVGFV